MKVKMLLISCLVLGFGVFLYGCSNKFSSENNYPHYTVTYLDNHPKLVKKIRTLCHKAEAKLTSYSEERAFANTTFSKDCSNASQVWVANSMAPPPNVIHSAPNRDSVLYDVPKP